VLHHIREVKAENVLTNGLSEGTNGVHGDTAELDLLALAGEAEERGNVVHGGLEVGQKTVLGGMGSASDGASNDSLDRYRGSLEKTGKALHDQLEVLVNGLLHDLKQGIEGSACSALGSCVVDQVHDGRDEDTVLGRTLLLEPFAEAADGDTGGFPDTCILILETSLNDGPDVAHEGSHVLAATLDTDTKGENSTATMAGFTSVKVLSDEGTEGREDLSGRQVGGKTVDDAEGRLKIIMSARYPRRYIKIILTREGASSSTSSGSSSVVMGIRPSKMAAARFWL
jgi:hypothetical protein